MPFFHNCVTQTRMPRCVSWRLKWHSRSVNERIVTVILEPPRYSFIYTINTKQQQQQQQQLLQFPSIVSFRGIIPSIHKSIFSNKGRELIG